MFGNISFPQSAATNDLWGSHAQTVDRAANATATLPRHLPFVTGGVKTGHFWRFESRVGRSG